MTIKEVEHQTGLTRSNIRFYEQEQLIQPARNKNGYRDYSEKNVQDIEKIAYLRTLGISLDSIRKILHHEFSLKEVIVRQEDILDGQIIDLTRAKAICRQMRLQEDLDYSTLDVEAYVPEITEHWQANPKLFRMDSVSFLRFWGGTMVWGAITMFALLLAVLIYPLLPEQIPVQWSHGAITGEAHKGFLFAYPAACVLFRFLLRPYLYHWLNSKFICSDTVCDNIINFLCFAAFFIEGFTILFLFMG